MNTKKAVKVPAWAAVAVMLAVLAIVTGFRGFISKKGTDDSVIKCFEENRETAVKIAEDYFAGNSDLTEEIEGITNIQYWGGEHPIIEFTVGGLGIAPASAYYGFYYSPDDVPVAFQNGSAGLQQEEEGWSWQDGGDNKGYTRKIENCWYYFEASF